MKTLKNDPRFEYIASTAWDTVFGIWRNNEASNPAWIEHYKSRGYDTWDEWRKPFADALHASEREWKMYRIVDPLQSVPDFLGGPFNSWIKNQYAGEQMRLFSWLAQLEYCKQSEKVKSLLEHFPAATTITGVINNGNIVIIEGMHRCIALAIASRTGSPITTTLTIAMTDAENEQLPILGGWTA